MSVASRLFGITFALFRQERGWRGYLAPLGMPKERDHCVGPGRTGQAAGSVGRRGCWRKGNGVLVDVEDGAASTVTGGDVETDTVIDMAANSHTTGHKILKD